MQNENRSGMETSRRMSSWSRQDSEELVALYLMDYFATLDDYYLKEALTIARNDGVDFEKIMRRVRFMQS